MKNTFILALNEFNISILKDYSKKYNFKNIKKFLKFNISNTTTKDRYTGNNNQSGYLDPWTQWVSVNTQVDASKHKVKNLGDIPKLKYKQTWEKKKNINWYIWGLMNSSRRSAKNVKLFFPDPWVFSELAFPSRFNKLLKSIKKITKSRGDLDFVSLISIFKNIFSELILMVGVINFIKSLSIVFNGFLFLKTFKAVIFIVWWECIIFNYFSNYCKKKNENNIFYFFINCLAHAQHHYWEKKIFSNEIRFVLFYLDKIFYQILKLDNCRKIIIGGMSQKNSSNEELFLYEQSSHENFLMRLSINFTKVEKLMTNDAYIFFKNKIECKNALLKINLCKMKNKKIFDVIKVNDKCLFYKTSFIKKVKHNQKLQVGSEKINFNKYFKLITKRRGIHYHKGHIISDAKLFPINMYNHNFFNFI